MAKNPSSISTPFVAAGTEEIRKRSKYEEFVPTPDEFRFVPFVVEATGRLGYKASEFIDSQADLGKKEFTEADEEKAKTRRYMLRAINAAVVRGNARIIRKFRMQTVPPSFDQDSFHWPALSPLSPALPTAPPIEMSPLHTSFSNSQLNREASEKFLQQAATNKLVAAEEELWIQFSPNLSFGP